MNPLRRFFRCFQKSPLRIAYLLESTDLWGGVKVVFRHVESLQKLGYRAVVICQQPYPTWLKPGIGFVQQDPFDKDIGSNYDLVITTGFKLTPFHYQHQSSAKLIHLCQGFEGEFKEAIPTVTNTFENRDAKTLKLISENIVPYDPIKDQLLSKIEEALSMPKGNTSFNEELYSGREETESLSKFILDILNKTDD